MSEEEYNKRLESLQQYIPFLDNMIAQLKDPSKKNREQQLTKMESLHAMITDKKRRLKLETLNKCEDVISKLYLKVFHKPFNPSNKHSSSPLSTPASPSPTRDVVNSMPLTIPTERCEGADSYASKFDTDRKSYFPNIDVYNSAAESLMEKSCTNSTVINKSLDISKPPISLEDLKTLEEDVHEKITSSASLKELDQLRNKIAHQIIIEDIKSLSPSKRQTNVNTYRNQMNPTIPNYPMSSTKLSSRKVDTMEDDIIGIKPEINQSPIKEIKSPTETDIKTSKKESPKTIKPVQLILKSKPTNTLKEPASIFGNVLSNIDEQIAEHKKQIERRTSLTGNEEKISKSSGKSKDRRSSTDKEKKKHENKNGNSKQNGEHEKDTKNKSESKDRHKSESSKKVNDKKDKDSKNKHSTTKKDLEKKHKDEKSNDRKVSKHDKSTKDTANVSKDSKCKDVILEMPAPTIIDDIKKTAINDDIKKPTTIEDIKKSTATNEECKLLNIKNNDEPNDCLEIISRPPVYRRLADKYNPKPKKLNVDAEVDKTVSEKIEASMRIAPPKIPLLGPVPAPVPPSASLLACSQAEPELPSLLQNILHPGTTQIINNVVIQLKKSESEQMKRPSLLPTPPLRVTPPLLHNIPRLMSPPDSFVSEFSRDYGNHQIMQRSHFENHPQELCGGNQFIPPANTPNFIPPLFRPTTPTPPSFNHLERFNQPQHNFNQNSMEGIHNLDYYPPNAPIPTNQYCGGPPLLSPEIPHFTEHKPNHFGLPNRDMFSHQDDIHWRMEESRQWDRNNFENRHRGPMTYREYRELKESRDPRITRADRDSRDSRDSRDPRNSRDSRDIRDPRDMRDPRDIRDPRDHREIRDPRENREIIRDPRLQRDNSSRNPREPTKDPRLNRGLDRTISRDGEVDHVLQRDGNRGKLDFERGRSRDRDFSRDSQDRRRGRSRERIHPQENRFETKFDRLYSRTNRDRSRSRSRSRTDSNETFASPLNSLYSGKEEHKTGKGYGVQHFRIPKRKKEEEEELLSKLDDKINEDSDSVDKNLDDAEIVNKQDSLDNNEIDSSYENEENVEGKDKDKTEKIENKQKDNEEINQHTSVIMEEIENPETNDDCTKEFDDHLIVDDQLNKLDTSNENISKKHDNIVQEKEKQHLEDKVASEKTAESEISKPPPEQTILAQFFANLLGSQNKKEKKTALYSLINTFSDSFSPKELSKITKIIRADDDDEEEEECSDDENKTNKEEPTVLPDPNDKLVEVHEQVTLELKEPNEESENIKTIKKPKIRKRVRRISSTSPTKEDSASSAKENSSYLTKEDSTSPVKEEKEKIDVKENSDSSKEINNSDPLLEDQVVVSVGERIKSRKRISSTSIKPKKKARTELDMLHEDIQDMFIRDGVLTATGKRMCCLLKDDPNALTTSTSEEPPKIRKKPGPKPKPKQSPVTDLSSLRNVRVVIPKIPESTMEENSRRTTRRMTRNMNRDESEEELDNSVSEEKTPKDSTDIESSDTEKDLSQTSESSHKLKIVKRKRGKKWASGIIEKKKKKDKPTTNDSPEIKENEGTFLPGKDHYVDCWQKSHQCKLCDFEGRFITTHYKHTHPESEVITSRLSPSSAKEAIKDAKEHLAKYEAHVNATKASTKLHVVCRFCSFETTMPPTHFYDHLSSHTGEYRHICPLCSYSCGSGKTLKVHIKNNHESADTPIVRKSYNNTIQFGYLCGECNYVQMNQNNIIEHINIYHLQKTTIHKINMSTFFDPEIEKYISKKSQAITIKSEDENSTIINKEKVLENKKHNPETSENSNEEVLTPLAEPPSFKRKKPGYKPGPKSRKKMIELEKQIELDTSESAEIPNRDLDVLKTTPEAVTKENDISLSSVARRKSITISNEDSTPTTIRTKRAAKEKAQEKLRVLAESGDSPVRKKSVSNEENKKVEESTKELPKQIDENISIIEIKNKLESENEAAEQISQNEKKKCVKQEVDLNVFTCKTDIQEENKKIEQERLQKMEELNKSVGNRTSLNFVDKLCNRLNQNPVNVKQEPIDDFMDNHYRESNKSPLTMPILEKSLPLPETLTVQPSILNNPMPKKPILETECTQLPTTSFDVTQKNDKIIVNMIEKLKDKLASSNNDLCDLDNTLTIDDDYDSEGPPPLTHVNELENVKPLDSSAKSLLLGGLIKVIKTSDSTTFCCMVPPCAYSTDKENSFQWHCKMAHRPKSIGRFTTLCESCGLEIKSTLDANLLENLFKHMINEHNDFLKSKSEITDSNSESDPLKNNVESINSETTNKTTNTVIRIRKLSGDALSVVRKDWEDEIDKFVNTNKITDEIESELNKKDQNTEETCSPSKEQTESVGQLELSDENPFPFKIADVVSLAESQQDIPPLAPIAKQHISFQSTQQLVVKEAKLPEEEIKKPRKAPKAMAKLLSTVTDLYKCPHYYCLFSTNFKDFLERHLKAHKIESDVMVACVYCDMKTPWEHVPMHIDVRHSHCKYSCTYCFYRAISKEYVYLHQDQEHPSKDYSVVALPLLKSTKKFAVAEQKIDPKILCEPYKCSHYCNAEFLFLNEFRRHLVMVHGNNNFIMCGYQNCMSRIVVDKIPLHWAVKHGVCLYQCGYCKTSNNELKKMYYHSAEYHPSHAVNIIVRMLQPLQDKITLGYSPEAFKKLRKVATIPNVTETKIEDNPINSAPVPTVPAISALPTVRKEIPFNYPKSLNATFANTTLQNKGVLIPTVSTSGKAFSLVTTATPASNKTNLLLFPGGATTTSNFESLLTVNPTIITSMASPAKLLKVVPSTVSLLTATTEASITTPIVTNNIKVAPICSVNSILTPTPIPTTVPITSTPISLAIPSISIISDANSMPEVKEQTTINKDTNIPPVEHVILKEEATNINATDDHMESENDPLDLSDLNENNSHMFSSDDESDNTKADKQKKKIGLLGYQLYRCSFCDFNCSNSNELKKHISGSLQCRSVDNPTKPFVCVHCKKHFRNTHVLVEHIQCHGILRFTCSLCENKFPTATQARNHMKQRHNVNQTTLSPLNILNMNIDTDEYIVKPKLLLGVDSSKQTSSESQPLQVSTENVYMPEDIEKIPIRSIFSYHIKCGICSYSSKVRTNIVRHLQFHFEEKAVPDIAPVNPVPCLEKNEKMFDKMINLASSSHTGRMGSTKEIKDKEQEKLPEFVPAHNRYVCCAHGCQYLCPEEANLRHHLIALHDGETSFTCVHCKANITPTDAENLIKHFKLHGLQLYKCHYCNFLHHLKHKVEKHITDGHLDLAVKVVTIRHLESEPSQEPSTSGTQNIPQAKLFRPWRCCICKTRSNSQEGIQNHVLEKHEIDSQYKCALCIYKNNDKNTFIDHFKENHDNKEIDIIYAYRKIEEGPKDGKEGETFDTTPLWQRDRPRVRHIRGILFEEESSPVPSKSPKKNKTIGTPSPTKSNSNLEMSTPKIKNIDVSIESVANGTADILQYKAPEKITEEVHNSLDNTKKDIEDDVIIIDDDDDEVSKTPPITPTTSNTDQLKKKAIKRKNSEEVPGITKIQKLEQSNLSNEKFELSKPDDYEFSENNLKLQFGEFGLPLQKQLKCPKCNKFKSKRISDFMFHIFKEMKIYRFKCRICSDESITYRYMFNHVKEHKKNEKIGDNIIALPSHPKLEVWLQMLIYNQSLTVVKSLNAVKEVTHEKDKNVQCYHCKKWYKTEAERNEHSITHWTNLPYKCDSCQFTAFTSSEIEKHFDCKHSSFSLSILANGPTVAKELKNADMLHMNEVKDEVGSILVTSFINSNDNTSIEINIPEVILSESNVPKIHITEDKQIDPIQDPLQADILDNLNDIVEPEEEENKREETVEVEKGDDLVIVTKMDRNVPNDGDVYCCEYCPNMSNSEISIMSHISRDHEHMHVKFKVLNIRLCNKTKSEYVSCSLCQETGSEIQIRQHYLELHQGQTFMTYRFTCSYCNKKFMRIPGLKNHSGRTHPGLPLMYSSIYNDGDKTQSSSSFTKEKKDDAPLRCYKCPQCSYARNFPSHQFGNVRTHLRNHFKSYSCGLCKNSKFRNKIDATNHFTKEHPTEPENITYNTEIEENYHKALKEIHDKSILVAVQPLTTTNTARKSTSTPQKIPEEYSYYGLPVEHIDLSKIMTSVEINGMHLDMSADKLSKIFDLQPQLYIKDCSLSMDLPETFDS